MNPPIAYRIDIDPNHFAGEVRSKDGSEVDVWQFTYGEPTKPGSYKYINKDETWPEALLDSFNVFLLQKDVAHEIEAEVKVHWQMIDLIGDGEKQYCIINPLRSVLCKTDRTQMPSPVEWPDGIELAVSSKGGDGPAHFCGCRFRDFFKKRKFGGVFFHACKI
jgi:hypothetical protein